MWFVCVWYGVCIRCEIYVVCNGECVCAVCSMVPVYMWGVALYLYLLMGGKDIKRDA